MPDQLWFLRRLNLFDGMTDAEVESVGRHLRMRHCTAGSSALGGASDRIYLVKEGRVRLYHVSREGQEVTTAVLGPGQLFGLGSLFGNRSQATQAVPVQESVICDANAGDFLEMLTTHPLLMARVMMAMARQLVRLQETLESVLSQPVSGRLASLVVSMLDQAESSPEGPLLPALSQEEISKMIGATRESVSRTLSIWRRHGIVANRGRRLLVRKLQILRDRAVESA